MNPGNGSSIFSGGQFRPWVGSFLDCLFGERTNEKKKKVTRTQVEVCNGDEKVVM